MSGSVGNDELASIGAEVAIGHVNGDTLLALGLQSVKQQGIVNLSCTGIAHPLAVALQGGELVLIEFLAVEKQTSNQRALSIIDTARGEQSKQILFLVGIKKCLYIQ